MFDIFTQGLIIGFLIAAPVGPIGVLCIKRTLTNNSISGFLTGLGAACADGIYGIIAAFSLTIISSYLLEYKLFIQSIGILFLIYIGIKSYREKTNFEISKKKSKDFISSFFLTITNPMTILSFIAIISSLGLTSNSKLAIYLVLGIFLGSLFWWFILIILVKSFRKKINPNYINKISGILIIFFAIYLIINSI